MTTTQSARRYYAARYAYGQRTAYQCADGPRIIRAIYAFETPVDRDRWVDDGPDYGQPGARETVTRRDIRQDIVRSARTSPTGSPLWLASDNGSGAIVLF